MEMMAICLSVCLSVKLTNHLSDCFLLLSLPFVLPLSSPHASSALLLLPPSLLLSVLSLSFSSIVLPALISFSRPSYLLRTSIFLPFPPTVSPFVIFLFFFCSTFTISLCAKVLHLLLYFIYLRRTFAVQAVSSATPEAKHVSKITFLQLKKKKKK